ncbi:MAG: metallophosphoesterase [Infirmifilum sp.]
MRIAVISDSHDHLEALNNFITKVKGEVEVIIHAGDIVSPFALRALRGFKVYAVFGNNDGEKLLLKKTADELGIVLEEPPLFLTLEDKKIAVIHGASTPDKTELLVQALAQSGLFHLVIYGHTHKADVRKIKDTLIVNPGTISGYLAPTRTFAVVDLDSMHVDLVEV